MSVVRRFNRTVEKKMRKKVCQESLGESILLGTLGIIWLRVTLLDPALPVHVERRIVQLWKDQQSQ